MTASNSSSVNASQFDGSNESIDWAFLNELTAGDREMQQQVLSTLVETLFPQLELLRKYISEQDFDQIYREAHSLKGATVSLGVNRLAALAAQVENLAQEQRLELLNDILVKLEQEVIQLQTLVKQFSL